MSAPGALNPRDGAEIRRPGASEGPGDQGTGETGMNKPLDICDARGDIETCLIMALYATMPDKDGNLVRETKKNKGWKLIELDMGKFCPSVEYPKDSFTLDMQDSSRIFSADRHSLVTSLWWAAASGLETMMLVDGTSLKWGKMLPMHRPRGLVAMTNEPHRWFSYHFRTYTENGSQDYVRHPFAITEDNRCVPIKVMGDWKGYNSSTAASDVEKQVCLMLTVFEDAIRSGAFLATVEESVKLRFPVGQAAYKDFMRLRDGPNETPTGRKNPILHWCARHLRQVSRGPTVVSKHTRGTETLQVGPMRLTIEPTPGYAAFMSGTEQARNANLETPSSDF
jgi:hypothetical protein